MRLFFRIGVSICRVAISNFTGDSLEKSDRHWHTGEQVSLATVFDGVSGGSLLRRNQREAVEKRGVPKNAEMVAVLNSAFAEDTLNNESKRADAKRPHGRKVLTQKAARCCPG
ncbi:hypothetical protein [Thalassoglobus sp.]|uniref:hypothetical protein n=1 Tax=Thalassoglobus sp. TaxID=2795869 RepID=UPI003AA87029